MVVRGELLPAVFFLRFSCSPISGTPFLSAQLAAHSDCFGAIFPHLFAKLVEREELFTSGAP